MLQLESTPPNIFDKKKKKKKPLKLIPLEHIHHILISPTLV